MVNNIHDKVFTCPKCTNKTLYPVNGNNDIVGILIMALSLKQKSLGKNQGFFSGGSDEARTRDLMRDRHAF